ncbi:hypothetical protein LA080_000403 [Diaporthe eres]|uniref:EF-hand domain-containing protein n=1 Tax=Diaporthe vaccinii TaxID=105482 RepID=A0ABR4EF12_9PEZI|nr:hypothetical protein LA080_000403 [Diaporthe eres]
MKYLWLISTLICGIAVAAPVKDNSGDNGDVSSAIQQIQSNLDRNNPNGTPANGSEDDLNGDGVINLFEAGAQADKRANKDSDVSTAIEQIQSNLDRDNPNGTPANGSPDDLNGDGVINFFEAGAQAD